MHFNKIFTKNCNVRLNKLKLIVFVNLAFRGHTPGVGGAIVNENYDNRIILIFFYLSSAQSQSCINNACRLDIVRSILYIICFYVSSFQLFVFIFFDILHGQCGGGG